MRLFNYIFGYHILECSASDTERILTLFMRCGIAYRDLDVRDGICSFCVSALDSKRICTLLANESIAVIKNDAHGLLRVLARYRRRVGLLFGAALFFLTVYVSGLFIWEVNVDGNMRISEREVRELLEEYGICVGAYIPSLDIGTVSNQVLANTKDLSWLAVNMNGTSANIVVRETELTEKEEESAGAANLVASADAQIELVEVYQGTPVVRYGDAVRAGELLVSGVRENPNSPVGFVRAKGKVYARTTKHICVEIPLEYEKKVYTGEKKSQKSIIFFGKSINLFVNSGNSDGNYDKIEREDPLTFFGSFTVPISLRSIDYAEYTYTTTNRTQLEAVRLAHHELSLALEEALAGAELLRKTITAFFSEDAYVIECELYVIENIAVPAEFETE